MLKINNVKAVRLLFISAVHDYPCAVCQIPCKWSAVSWHRNKCISPKCEAKPITDYQLLFFHKGFYYNPCLNNATSTLFNNSLVIGKPCYMQTRSKNGIVVESKCCAFC